MRTDLWRAGCVAALAATLLGCSTKVVRVDMDIARLDVPRVEPLSCRYRLQAVEDVRPQGDQAGGLGARAFRFPDAAAVVRRQLAGAGMVDRDDGSARAVTVHLLQLYLAQNGVSKVPVTVYRVTVDNEAPFLVRSQKTTMNWNGTENEAYAAYARALADANQQLVHRLNSGCPQESAHLVPARQRALRQS